MILGRVPILYEHKGLREIGGLIICVHKSILGGKKMQGCTITYDYFGFLWIMLAYYLIKAFKANYLIKST